MLFNSFDFIYLFLPIVYFGFWRLKTKDHRYIWLTIASYVFYGHWNKKFCLLMAFSTLVSYAAGRALGETQDPKRRKWLMWAPITIDLLLLGFFKYTDFLLETAQSVGYYVGWGGTLPRLNILLPIGISFYTFHTITYIVDSYRGVIKPTKNFWEFACYVSLFSQLVAGPIVRFRQVEADLESIDHTSRTAGLNRGWSFFVIGMIKKVLIADTLAVFVDPAFKDPTALSTWGAWLGALAYTYQLYFDFSGYSDMAVGLGLLFGIRLPQNFNSPYQADSIADFWRRWHISLSSCLRDYLYIPLGGSRAGDLRVACNLMVTMLLGGLWHGAHWTFVVWGGYHGLLLVIHRQFRESWDQLPRRLRQAVTFLLVIIGWVLFRSPDFASASVMLGKMFHPFVGIAPMCQPTLLALLLIAAVIAHLGRNTFELRHEWQPVTGSALLALLAVCLFVMYGSQSSPFLYFQF